MSTVLIGKSGNLIIGTLTLENFIFRGFTANLWKWATGTGTSQIFTNIATCGSSIYLTNTVTVARIGTTRIIINAIIIKPAIRAFEAWGANAGISVNVLDARTAIFASRQTLVVLTIFFNSLVATGSLKPSGAFTFRRGCFGYAVADTAIFTLNLFAVVDGGFAVKTYVPISAVASIVSDIINTGASVLTRIFRTFIDFLTSSRRGTCK